MPGFVNKFFISVQLIVFLDHVLPLVELAQKFKIAVGRSVSMKRNFKGFTFNHSKDWAGKKVTILYATILMVKSSEIL